MTLHRTSTTLPYFMQLDPARTQYSHGPNSHSGSLPRVAVLHQGHVDNYHDLHALLQKRGYPFETNSDGELIAHLIDAIHPGNPLQAVQRVMALLQGQSTFAVQFHDHPYRLITAQSGTAQTPSQLIDMKC